MSFFYFLVMKRLTLSLFAASLLALNACSTTDSKTAETNTSTTGSAAPEVTATDSGSMAAPADTSKMGAMAPAGATSAAAPNPNGPTAPHADDAEFMKSAAHSDQNEIQLSKMALAKGVSGEAKTLANQMIADHTKSTAALKPIAANAKVTLPTDMDAEHKAMAPQLEKLSAKEFEAKYLAQMVTDHQKTANTLAAHKTMTKNAALSGWIDTTLPVVVEHLSMSSKDATMKM
jgi:putative membrane protein